MQLRYPFLFEVPNEEYAVFLAGDTPRATNLGRLSYNRYMKKYLAYIISAVVVVALAAYFILSQSDTGPVAVTTPEPTPDTTGQGTPTSSNSGGETVPPPPTTTPPVTKPPQAAYKDGVYTGIVANAIFGKLQIVATIENGKLVKTTWPIYPSDGGHTLEVSNSSLPELNREAIVAQSAKVDTVSGATQTSDAYRESLASALAQAKM